MTMFLTNDVLPFVSQKSLSVAPSLRSCSLFGKLMDPSEHCIEAVPCSISITILYSLTTLLPAGFNGLGSFWYFTTLFTARIINTMMHRLCSKSIPRMLNRAVSCRRLISTQTPVCFAKLTMKVPTMGDSITEVSDTKCFSYLIDFEDTTIILFPSLTHGSYRI